jgi:hypothetical protein
MEINIGRDVPHSLQLLPLKKMVRLFAAPSLKPSIATEQQLAWLPVLISMFLLELGIH